MTTKAPVGPPIWTLEAAQGGDEEAGDDGRDQPLVRGHARGDGESDGQGQGDDADDDAGGGVFEESGGIVAFERRQDLGMEERQRRGGAGCGCVFMEMGFERMIPIPQRPSSAAMRKARILAWFLCRVDFSMPEVTSCP